MSKLTNDYQRQIDDEVYEKCPKAVFAAIAASYAIRYADDGEMPVDEWKFGITNAILTEWYALWRNGIVPQKPPFPDPEK